MTEYNSFSDRPDSYETKLPDRREVDDYFDSFTGHKERSNARSTTRSTGRTAARRERGSSGSAAQLDRAARPDRTARRAHTETAERRERPRRSQTSASRNPSSAGRNPSSAGRNPSPAGRSPQGPKLPLAIIGLALLLLLLLVIGAAALAKKGGKPKNTKETTAEETLAEEIAETEPAIPFETFLDEADRMAAMYDYDKAMDHIRSYDGYAEIPEASDAIKRYEAQKAECVEYDIMNVTHIFFHILDVDPVNSFDESKWGKQAGGYNSLMTTIDEFNKMMDEMYAKGYVLVRLHDMAHEEVDENGKTVLVKGSIMLPPGKKAFVMSEDDVCYYEYMTGAGFADKMIVGEDGRPTCHYTDKDGNESVGNYDVAPLLDAFIDEHPDFSYRGAKACLVFTGYNGILGYRTDESYDPNSEYYDEKLEKGHDIQKERKEAIKVLRALHEDGFELGSHSWGHLDMGQISFERFQRDSDRWDRNVAPLILEATGKKPDIIIFPKGADIGDWHPYSSDNARFKYYYDLGFRFFCNVDNTTTWVQKGDTYLRQGRRALDGYNMWRDITGEKNRMSDLFDDVSAIFDKARPTPVPTY